MPRINVKKKGNRFEVWTANYFKDVLGFKDAKRNLTETQTGGQGIDLVGTGKFDVQCKRYKDYVTVKKLFEVPVVEGRIALLITKADKKEPLVALRLSDFATLLGGNNVRSKESC